MKNYKFRVFALLLSLFMAFSAISCPVFADKSDNTESTALKSADNAFLNVISDDDSYSNYNLSFSNATTDISVPFESDFAGNEVSFKVNIPSDALYKFGFSYLGRGSEKSDFVFGMKIDGKYPFKEAQELTLYRIFTNDSQVRKDGNGNVFSPKQVPYDKYFFDNVADITKWSDDDYLFALTAGEHIITLVKGIGEFSIKNPVFSASCELKKYSKPSNNYFNGERIIIEGEDAKIKTGYWLSSKSDNSSLSISPVSAYNTYANYIGGGNWKTSGQSLTWKTKVDKSGYYKLGFSYRQSAVIGAKVYRTLQIDGVCPFDEATAVGFKYSYDWQQGFFEDDKGNPYLIYLEKGEHELSLEVSAGDITSTRDLLKDAVAQIGDLYVDITMITGESVDINRDYDLFAQIDGMEKTLKDIKSKLHKSSANLQKLTGEKSGSYISVINNMEEICRLMLINKYTAHRYKDEYYSKYTSLASVLYEMSEMPLDIDKISLCSPDENEPFETHNFFENFGFSVEKFFVSFTQDYNNISSASGGSNSITIWVNWGRDQAQVLNSLIQSEFAKTEYAKNHNISVDVQIVNATVVQAVLSGKGPDCLLQHSHAEPVNLAMRGMLHNLKQFDDWKEVVDNFQDGAELPYYYKDGLYGLPDTQSFYLMFYRTDIFAEMGLNVPETWDEFKEVSKLLARNNLSVWMPNNTATTTAQANVGIGAINLFPTLLLQKNLPIYKEDGRATNLTDSEVIKSFGDWTGYYTKLKLPRTMNFYNRFRTGTCPLGIDIYTQYTTLKAAAPEIAGLWNVALVPGTVDEKGNINHTTSGGGTACSILKLTKNPKASWEFLKWWVSKETQLSFSSEVESILGPTGRVSVSNVEAFKSLEWDREMKDVIIEAMNQTSEIPEYPGSYYVSRSVYQAFWNVVENNQNIKKTLLQHTEEADEEIERKWKQYENRDKR